MQYTLSNDNFEVIVDSKGCEIVSVIRKSDNKQYIWSGQPDIWKRHNHLLVLLSHHPLIPTNATENTPSLPVAFYVFISLSFIVICFSTYFDCHVRKNR